MKQHTIHNEPNGKMHKSTVSLDPRLVALVKLLAKNAAEEDNAAFHYEKIYDPRTARDAKDSK